MNPDSSNPLVLFLSFGLFPTDFDVLVNNGIIVRITNDHYDWTKSKTSLAEYFKRISIDENVPYVPGGFWSPIENIFTIKGKPITKGSLRRLAGNNANPCKPDESKDYKEIMNLVLQYREKMNKQAEQDQKSRKTFSDIKTIINKTKDNDIKKIRAALKKIKTVIT
jgi:hypothetical protein